MPATHVLPCLWCLRRRGGCLQPTLRGRGCMQPTLFRACGACGEEKDACNQRLTVPAVPAGKGRMPATHVLPCLRCPRQRGGCLQSTFCCACGAGGEEIKFKEKTRSCLNQTGSDFSLNLTWIYVACAGQVNDEKRGRRQSAMSNVRRNPILSDSDRIEFSPYI